ISGFDVFRNTSGQKSDSRFCFHLMFVIELSGLVTCPSGRRCNTRNVVYGNPVPWVQIPPSPPRKPRESMIPGVLLYLELVRESICELALGIPQRQRVAAVVQDASAINVERILAVGARARVHAQFLGRLKLVAFADFQDVIGCIAKNVSADINGALAGTLQNDVFTLLRGRVRSEERRGGK